MSALADYRTTCACASEITWEKKAPEDVWGQIKEDDRPLFEDTNLRLYFFYSSHGAMQQELVGVMALPDTLTRLVAIRGPWDNAQKLAALMLSDACRERGLSA